MDRQPHEPKEHEPTSERENLAKVKTLSKELFPVIDAVSLSEARQRVVEAWQAHDRERAVREMDVLRDMGRNVVLGQPSTEQQRAEIGANLMAALVWLEAARLDKFVEELGDVYDYANLTHVLSDVELEVIGTVGDHFYALLAADKQ